MSRTWSRWWQAQHCRPLQLPFLANRVLRRPRANRGRLGHSASGSPTRRRRAPLLPCRRQLRWSKARLRSPRSLQLSRRWKCRQYHAHLRRSIVRPWSRRRHANAHRDSARAARLADEFRSGAGRNTVCRAGYGDPTSHRAQSAFVRHAPKSRANRWRSSKPARTQARQFSAGGPNTGQGGRTRASARPTIWVALPAAPSAAWSPLVPPTGKCRNGWLP